MERLESMERRVEALLAEILSMDEEEVGPAFPFNELAPIDVARLIIACEEAFRLDIPDEDVRRLVCLQDLTLRLAELLDA